MSKKVALFFHQLNDSRMEKIRAAAPGYIFIDMTKNESDEALADCEIAFGHMSPEQTKAARNLKWLHTQSAGVDSYLKPGYGLPETLTLTNSSGAYGLAISEHLLTVTLMLFRRMGEYARLQSQHKWEDRGCVQSMFQSVVTVVGLGDIGTCYAKRCHVLGATVRGVVRNPRSDKPDYVENLFAADKLDEAIAGADVVALCLPGTDETAHIIDKPRMMRLKKGAYILNIGRGSAIEQDALIEFLENGHLGGAGLDVTTPEPLPKDSKLWDMHNVILTPHVSGGASMEYTLDLIVDKFARYLKDFAAGAPFVRVVDKALGY